VIEPRHEFHDLPSGVRLHAVHWDPTAVDSVDAGLTPWLLVHGLASNARLWDGVGRHLAGLGHRVVAIDQRGHGQSSKPDDGYDMATVAGEGCRACMACRTVSDHCVVEDGVGEVLRAFIDTDVLVMAAPVWFLEFPCSIRRFIERWHALLTAAFESRLPSGKKAVLLISQGGAEGEFKELPARYVEMLGWLGVSDVQIVRHCNAEECPVHERGEILDDVRDAAVHVLG